MKKYRYIALGLVIVLIAGAAVYAFLLDTKVSYLPAKSAIYQYRYKCNDYPYERFADSQITVKGDTVRQTTDVSVYSGHLFGDFLMSAKYVDLYGRQDTMFLRPDYAPAGYAYVNMRFPISKGASWDFGYTQGTYKVLADNETIATPAGEFKHVLVISRTRNYSTHSTNETHYYAPNIGLIRQDDNNKPVILLCNIVPTYPTK